MLWWKAPIATFLALLIVGDEAGKAVDAQFWFGLIGVAVLLLALSFQPPEDRR